MPTSRMTFTVPEALRRRAQAHREINWSAVVSRALEDQLAALELADRIARRSLLTEEDVDVLADAVDEAMARRFGVPL